MANLELSKANKIKVLNSFPSSFVGKEGDLIISKISGKGKYLCAKVGGTWFAADKLNELNRLTTPKMSDLTVNSLKAGRLSILNKPTGGEIDLSAGNLLLDVAGDIELNADGGDIVFKDDTVTLLSLNSTVLDLKPDNAELRFHDGGYYTGFKAHATMTGNAMYTLPAAYPASNKVLQSTSAGALSWVDDSDSTHALDDLSDVTLSGGDLTITGLDEIVAAGDLTLDVAGDISLNADGGDITFKDGLAPLFDITVGRITVYYDASNYTQTTVSSAGAVTLSTVGGTPTDADLRIDAGGDITLDSGTGVFIASKAGTQFSAANSSYAGMILGYTDIGLNEAHDAYTLTTSYVVPKDEFSVAFTAPPSGKVSIELQVQHYFGSNGLGDLYGGLSTANATSGYSALASYHEKRLEDSQGRSAVGTVRISWTLIGLTGGDDYEYWAGFKVTSTTGGPTLTWGGNASGRYPDFIMKAIALPATITT